MSGVNLLLTNDDGIEFPGIMALKEAFEGYAENIFIFGPAMEKSATSQAMTIYDDIYVKPLDSHTYIVNGFPVDCVNVALYGELLDVEIDLIVSGINKGVNMGEDVLYSGTVGAARHGFSHGISALAVSCGYLDKEGDFASVARFTRRFVESHRELLFSSPQLWNINHPPYEVPDKKIKWTKLGQRIYRDKYKRRSVEQGAFLMNLGGSELFHKETEGSDFAAYEAGFVSITPLQTDATDYQTYNQYRQK